MQAESLTYIFPVICQPLVLHAGRQPAMPLANGTGIRIAHCFIHLTQALHLTVDVPLLNPHSTGYRTLKLTNISYVSVKLNSPQVLAHLPL